MMFACKLYGNHCRFMAFYGILLYHWPRFEASEHRQLTPEASHLGKGEPVGTALGSPRMALGAGHRLDPDRWILHWRLRGVARHGAMHGIL